MLLFELRLELSNLPAELFQRIAEYSNLCLESGDPVIVCLDLDQCGFRNCG